MLIKFCDRCGKVTKNRIAFLLPVPSGAGNYQCDGVWFGSEGMVLCNDCLKEFESFKIASHQYNQYENLIHETEN